MGQRCWVRSLTHKHIRAPLFNHLVGECEYLGWNIKAERPGGFEIDHQLKLSRLLDRQVSRPLALEDPASVDANQAVNFRVIVSVADRAAGLDHLAQWIHRRNRMARSQRHDLI